MVCFDRGVRQAHLLPARSKSAQTELHARLPARASTAARFGLSPDRPVHKSACVASVSRCEIHSFGSLSLHAKRQLIALDPGIELGLVNPREEMTPIEMAQVVELALLAGPALIGVCKWAIGLAPPSSCVP